MFGLIVSTYTGMLGEGIIKLIPKLSRHGLMFMVIFRICLSGVKMKVRRLES